MHTCTHTGTQCVLRTKHHIHAHTLTQADSELQRAQRMNEHKALDIKTLKSALKHRDEQVWSDVQAEVQLRHALRPADFFV